MPTIRHGRCYQSDDEIINLKLEYFLEMRSTQFEAVLNATPLARRRVGNISEGMVQAIGPHEIPYDNVKKSTSEVRR